MLKSQHMYTMQTLWQQTKKLAISDLRQSNYTPAAIPTTIPTAMEQQVAATASSREARPP